MARTRPWEVSDALWEHVAHFIPPTPSYTKGGRPCLPDRQTFEANVYVLRTDIQWRALPRELGASSTIHDRFQQWEQAGPFKALWQAGLAIYDKLVGVQWEWQAIGTVEIFCAVYALSAGLERLVRLQACLKLLC
ncbi:hypothetical protein KSX_04130 [Ktedonospora formicarum]|uniref:Insertion element IS402-like domain-containing protein n=1 Tax=Ktedonospora formicarum TaxID=2778364 RepID=A0A8J3MNT8_9CHLR|nr:hypothetical protein KSX_04130 [Ktedonospora formicarum]